MDDENPLWKRVAALRGVEVTKPGEPVRVAGERFQIQVSRVATAPNINSASRVLCEPGCRGVIGEFVVKRHEFAARARVATRRGLSTTPPPDWRRALLEREAERLARMQPERRST
jgi:hypothetical protein